ncbi:hypothetical protein J437_LFUL009063 [Ladona fulva]|uniref:Reverse transcriptase domain-containing protein n=1 Tax=Ladona fulva TaxID=123851 RepID=A0A8K0K856_LADFU|nr:hypothetical protein J437_LFUL009063 [Ladona fulva]
MNVDKRWEEILDNVSLAVERSTTVTHWRNEQESRPWSNIEVKEALKKRDTYYKTFKLSEAARLSNEIVTEKWKRDQSSRNEAVMANMDETDLNLIKDNWEVLGRKLLALINTSLREGKVPTSLKVSTVVPIPKVGGSKKCSQMRPLIEECVKKQLLNYIQEKEILFNEQLGFIEKHLTETVIQIALEDPKTVIGAVFLSIMRAFETVNTTLLMRKLQTYGIGVRILDWITCMIGGRREGSTPWIPQDSKLGHLLFILYINDLPRVVKNGKIFLFADDALIFMIAKNYIDVVEALNKYLNNVANWVSVKSLKLNTSKTKAMILGSCVNLTRMIQIECKWCRIEQ